jgi:hypothetical protein
MNTESNTTSFAPRLTWWLPLFLLACCFLSLGWFVSVPYDIWWQLANGREIVQTGQLVTADPFTFTISGQPYLDKYWIFEWLAYQVFNRADWAGLQGLHLMLLALTGLSVFFSVRHRPRWTFLLLAFPAMILLEQRSSFRGYLLSFIMLPIFLRMATSALNVKNPHCYLALAGLAGLQILWTNLHSEFFWGLIIAGALSVDFVVQIILAKPLCWKRLLYPVGVMLLLLACCLVNPFGWQMPLGIIREAGTVALRPVSAEWLPFSRWAQWPGWMAWFSLVILTSMTFMLGRKKISFGRALLFVFFMVLSLRSFRFIGPMALVCVFIGMENMASVQFSKPLNRLFNFWIGVVTALLLLGFFRVLSSDRFYHWQRELKRFGTGMLTSEMPVDACAFIRENNIQGNFLNEWTYGGYLIWQNYPAIRVAEDGRTAPFPPALSQEIRSIFEGNGAALDRFDQQYSLNGAVVPWYAGQLQQLLGGRPDWLPIFVGAHSSVWLKRPDIEGVKPTDILVTDPATFAKWIIVDPQQAFNDEPWLTFPTAVYRRGLFFIRAGFKAEARLQMNVLKAHDAQHVLYQRLLKAWELQYGTEAGNE